MKISDTIWFGDADQPAEGGNIHHEFAKHSPLFFIRAHSTPTSSAMLLSYSDGLKKQRVRPTVNASRSVLRHLEENFQNQVARKRSCSRCIVRFNIRLTFDELLLELRDLFFERDVSSVVSIRVQQLDGCSKLTVER